MPRCPQLLDVLYKDVRIKMFAALEPLANLGVGDLPISRVDDLAGSILLRGAMEEAGHWDTKEVSRRWLLGDACYMVVDGGACVHYSWVSSRVLCISEIGYMADIDGENHWIYNAHTSPSHRGRSIFPRVLQRMLADFLTGKGGVAWAGVQDGNLSSAKSVVKAGFREAFVLDRKTLLSSMESRCGRRVIDAGLTAIFDASVFARGAISHAY